MRKFLFAILFVPTLASADKIQMKEGLWEMSGTVEMMGHKTEQPKMTHCVTSKDLDGTWFQQLPPGDCKADQSVTSSTVTWTLDCKMGGGAGVMKTNGKVNYTKTSFEGTAKMEIEIPQAGKQKGNMTMQGKYLGACKK